MVLPCGRPDDVPAGAPIQAGACAADQAGAPSAAQSLAAEPVGAPEPAAVTPTSADRPGDRLGVLVGSGPGRDSQQGQPDAAAGGASSMPALVAAEDACLEPRSGAAAALFLAADAAEGALAPASSPAHSSESAGPRPLMLGTCDLPCAAAAEGPAGSGLAPIQATGLLDTRPLPPVDSPSRAAAAEGAMSSQPGSGHMPEALSEAAPTRPLTPCALEPAIADGDKKRVSFEAAAGHVAEALSRTPAARPLTPDAFDDSFAAEAAAVLGSLEGAGLGSQGQGLPHGTPGGAPAQMGPPGGSAKHKRTESGGGASPGASAAAEAVVAAAAAAVGLDAEHAERLVQVTGYCEWPWGSHFCTFSDLLHQMGLLQHSNFRAGIACRWPVC